MASIKLTKSVVEKAPVTGKDYELRDTVVSGFLCKVTAKGRRVFMLHYRTNAGQRRKPVIGRYGGLGVDQARSIAQEWLGDIRRGHDPSTARQAARKALTVKELCTKFIEEYSKPRNKPRTVTTNQENIKRYIRPRLGRLKVPDVTRADIVGLMTWMVNSPTTANRVVACLRKMFNMAEVWGYRPDGSNPCRHVPMYPERGRTRYINDDELRRIYAYLDRADAEELEHPLLTLAIRLQFEFAARMCEIRMLEWAWVDFEQRRVTWPDSKTGGMSKPMSQEAYRLLSAAPRIEGSRYVCPSLYDGAQPMPEGTYNNGWTRIQQRANVPHVGTHGIRHRAATDIANSGVPVKVGMALTGHKTVAMFMRYVHTESEPVREAADKVASLRKAVIERKLADSDSGGAEAGPTHRHRRVRTRPVPPGAEPAAADRKRGKPKKRVSRAGGRRGRKPGRRPDAPGSTRPSKGAKA